VGIHVNTITHTEFRNYEKPGLNSNWWTFSAIYIFYHNVHTYLLLKSASLYSSQVQYKGSNQCFQTHEI